MHSPMGHTATGNGWGRMVLEFLLSKLVNQHTKRIIFITSLYTRISRMDTLQRTAMAKLNQLMVLARDENSLTFSTRFQNIIWNQTNINETLRPEILHAQMSESERLEISKRVVDMTPEYLRYRTRPEMVKDVFSLLSQYDNLQHAALAAT